MAKDSGSRGMRDEMHVGPDPRKTRHLVPLKELGKFKVADGDPDVRGWDVFTSTGREIGKVEDLLVDVDSGDVVMLDVDLRRNDRHTLAPIRATWVDRGAKRVVVDADEVRDALDDLPSFVRGTSATDEDVDRFDERYGRVYGRHQDDREYRVRHGDDELRFGRRADDMDEERLRAAEERRERQEELAEEAAERDRKERQRFVERHARREEEDSYRVKDAEGQERSVHYPERSQDEVIVERRPYVEEVVVRRRLADESELTDRDSSRVEGDRRP
jgi:sporulation protein YlmC with PRC-barrel domain